MKKELIKKIKQSNVNPKKQEKKQTFSKLKNMD